MTETKHSQESVIALPDKWFKLDYVAERWTHLSREAVTVDRLLHWQETGELRIAAFLIDHPYAKCLGSINPSKANEIEEDQPYLIKIRHSFTDKDGAFHIKPMEGLVYPQTMIASQLRLGEQITFDLCSTVEYATAICDFVFKIIDGYATATRDDLRITRVELERFEQAHGIGKPAQMPTINEDTELKRANRALGALARQFASDKGTLTTGNKPNVSQIAEYALNAVSDSQDEAPHGYSNTTLRDAIATALNTVNKDLSNR